MMRVLAGSTAIVLSGFATIARAQDAGAGVSSDVAIAPKTTSTSASAAQPDAQSDTSGDIVVTARRDAERLQDVPVSEQVVTGAAIQKLAITSATELTKLTPGLTLGGGGDGSTSRVVLRGVDWRPGSGTPATPIYFNEVPFDPQRTIQDLFDVQQVEVLRGPQGTSRGAPSISGAVTIATKRPDLRDFGGYVQGLYGSGAHKNVQGAVNVPLIEDVLAVRVAGYYEDASANRVYSVSNDKDPYLRDRVLRVTALFRPTDTTSIIGMYQRRYEKYFLYDHEVGPGSGGDASFGIPANFNGPALSLKQRRSAEDGGNRFNEDIDLITLNASWEVLGQKLSYNFGRQIARSGFGQRGDQDFVNFVPGGVEQVTSFPKTPFFQTNEIRLSSLRDPDRPFDYDAGWFSKHSGGPLQIDFPVLLAGALGPPDALPGTVSSVNQRFVLPAVTSLSIGQVFDSFYGNVRLHVDEDTELSGGLSILRDRVPLRINVQTGSAFIAITNPVSSVFSCEALAVFSPQAAGIITSPTYGAPTCEIPIPAGAGNLSDNFNNKYSSALYNFSVSRKFSPDILAYATTGSSFRSGLPAVGNNGLRTDLLVPKPEKATSYEVGLKTSFGRRLRVNADLFQINYSNQLTGLPNIAYFDSVTDRVAFTTIAFYRNVDARVRGAELEVAVEPINNLSLGANVSYSKIKSRGGSLPCNDPNAPAITADNPINFCVQRSGTTLNTQAPFQASVNGSYSVPLGEFARLGQFDGYLRFNANLQGKNPNFSNTQADGLPKRVPAYALVDLFAGFAGHNGGWELGAYVKNAFDKQVELSRLLTSNAIYAPFSGASGGYDVVNTTLPREIGVSLRYSFGKR